MSKPKSRFHDFIRRGQSAQRAVDSILPPERHPRAKVRYTCLNPECSARVDVWGRRGRAVSVYGRPGLAITCQCGELFAWGQS